MSSAPNANGPAVFESTTNEPAGEPPARTDVRADAALVRAALERMESSVHDTHATLARLRAALGEMAEVIAETKSALAANAEPTEGVIERRPVDTTALLDEFEHLVDAMIDIAGGAPAARPAPPALPQHEPPSAGSEVETLRPDEPAETDESSQVPTVSRVVTGRDAGDDIVAVETAPPPDAASGAPTLAMLKAMVEALNASVPPATAEPEPPAAASETPVAAPEEPSDMAHSRPMYREIIATPEPPALSASVDELAESAEPAVEPHHVMEALQDMPAALPSDISLGDLLASIEQIETRPIPPPEIGTAVIFPPRTDPAPLAQAGTAAPDVPADDGIPAQTSHAVPAPAEARKTASGDFDAEQFLFGPEPEPDPADFLLDPPIEAIAQESASAPPAPAAELPPVEFSVPTPPATAATEQVTPPQPPPDNVPYDPLAPLNAMTAEEKIALFS